MSVVLHPERVKAEIRMQHGTLRRFAEVSGLNVDQLRDYLRGRSMTAHSAVARLLDVDPDHLTLSRKCRCHNTRINRAHRLNGRAK